MASEHVTLPLDIASERMAMQPVARAETHRTEHVRLREFLAVSALVCLADITIFRGHGYTGLGLFWLVSPALLLLGRSRVADSRGAAFIALMMCLLAARAVWLGSPLGVAWGLVLLIAFSMALDGRRPYVFELLAYMVHLVVAGAVGWYDYLQAARRVSPSMPRLAWINLLLPLAALVVFGSLFVLANPDLVTAVLSGRDHLVNWLQAWIDRVDFPGFEIAFCLAAAYLSIALLRPLLPRPSSTDGVDDAPMKSPVAAQEAPLYGAIRNTLVAMIVLFAVYLVFEFGTLWFREFPKGFYYAGYAHSGAAWLTVALALATAVLSATFQGTVLQDRRLPRLKQLTWIWSAENLILAATVYNRMHIYVDFNGMTRMRMIGLFGITSVLVGFCLVLWKIIHRRGFLWLLRRQLWTVTIATYLFAITPVDWLVHRYNVQQILAGELAPSVQITEHPVNTEGMLMLEPLIDCDDSIIREGIRAMLAERAVATNALLERRDERNWTSSQLADRLLLDRLRARQRDWEPYVDARKREEAWQRFRDYAYQWY